MWNNNNDNRINSRFRNIESKLAKIYRKLYRIEVLLDPGKKLCDVINEAAKRNDLNVNIKGKLTTDGDNLVVDNEDKDD